MFLFSPNKYHRMALAQLPKNYFHIVVVVGFGTDYSQITVIA
ncbi:hypothetical protein VIBNIFTn2_120224 [Vibrio nigripulchritudo FTn2]|nr:hypothetical protein VIBNIFTn2_120224 [Vibrio nigripulchritudo FTn2]